jgi:molybdenum-dependent DNA-binding transcriptional regulator ModE
MSVNTDQKIIKNKVSLLNLADMLGSVSEACKVMGYSRDSFTGSRSCTTRAASWP